MIKKLNSNLLILSIFLPLLAYNQEWKEVSSTKFNLAPSSFSIDTENNIYLGFENGTLRKFSSEGDEFPIFSLPNQSSITLVEAQNNRRIFLFQKDIQQVTILDRFSANPKQYLLRDFDIDFAISACPAPDGTIWVVENNPQILKKIDLLRGGIIHKVQHDLGDSIAFMKVTQNLLLIADENGMQILDQFGNFLSSLKLRVKYLQVSKNEIIATYGEGFVRIDPYTSKVLQESAFLIEPANALLKLKEKYAVIHGKSLSFYIITNLKNE